MYVRSGLIRKKSDWSQEEFRRYWREHHSQMAAQLPGLLRYEQNHVVDSEQRGFTFPRGPEHLDGISMLWFESKESMKQAFATGLGQQLIADENHFIGDLRIVTLDQVEVIKPLEGPKLKRMSLLRRLPGVSPETFRKEWREEHAYLVKRLDQVLGYRQNLILEREVPKGNLVSHDVLPIDGIVELWFKDIDTISSAFGSPKGTTLMTHAREFIGEITTFLVECHVVR